MAAKGFLGTASPSLKRLLQLAEILRRDEPPSPKAGVSALQETASFFPKKLEGGGGGRAGSVQGGKLCSQEGEKEDSKESAAIATGITERIGEKQEQSREKQRQGRAGKMKKS